MILASVCISIAVLSYLLGSLNFGVIISNCFKKDDVRNHGSGNAGSTNMLRNYGKSWAILTIIGDMLKVAVAIIIAFAALKITNVSSLLENYFGEDTSLIIKSYAGLFAVIGHIFPCYFSFKGGKGVATAGGMVFMIDWRIALILLGIFFVVVLVTRFVSLGSIIMAILYPVFMLIFYKSAVLTVIALVFTLIVVVAHRGNIVKLINGTESKISFKKQKS